MPLMDGHGGREPGSFEDGNRDLERREPVSYGNWILLETDPDVTILYGILIPGFNFPYES